LQAIRFDADKFTVAEAKEWLRKHGHKPILFEPAAETKENHAMNHSLPIGLFLRSDPGGIKIEGAAAVPAGEKPALRRFAMTAYTGGPMALAGWPHPVVVDLSGLALGKKSRPILMDHNTGRIVGTLMRSTWRTAPCPSPALSPCRGCGEGSDRGVRQRIPLAGVLGRGREKGRVRAGG